MSTGTTEIASNEPTTPRAISADVAELTLESPPSEPATDSGVASDHDEGNNNPPPPPSVPHGSVLEYVHLEYIRNKNGNWVTKRREDPMADGDDEFGMYSFSILRDWDWDGINFNTYVQVKNDALRVELRAAIGIIDGFSWTDIPLRIDPKILLTFHPILTSHYDKLQTRNPQPEVLPHFKLLLDYLNNEHRRTLTSVRNLHEHKEITFDLLWSILIPKTILLVRCPVSGLPRAVRLLSSSLEQDHRNRKYYTLACECTDMAGATREEPSFFGRADFPFIIPFFKGTVPIISLKAFPLRFHPQEQTVRDNLIARGKRWATFDGQLHKRYDDIGYRYSEMSEYWLKVTVSSRIMVDKRAYMDFKPNHSIPEVHAFFRTHNAQDEFGNNNNDDSDARSDVTAVEEDGLTDEQFLLATPLLYGFSLSDKSWLAFKIDSVTDIVWQSDAFDNLILPPAQKSLIRALVQSHRGPGQEDAFDDFIEGKGKGLIINLFGPPGVGKTLSAEATSEHVRLPLYVVGVSEFGRDVEGKLKEIFEVAARWRAIVLLDEADVFMEQRSVNDLDRNALVAIFLRELEYYQGILFLTTNRVKVFDEAFQSRIHISLHYADLTSSAKKQIWRAFFLKAGMNISHITDEEWEVLGNARVNGRQIKNAVRSCQGLAASREEAMKFEHVREMLDVISQFEQDFRAQRE